MSRNIRLRCLLSLAAIALLVAVFAGAISAAPETRNIRVEAKQIVSEKKDKDIRITTFSTAKVYHEDAVFSATTIVVRSQKKDHEFTCTGEPVFTDPENRITSDKVIAYSTPRRAEFKGNVTMVSTPRQETKAKNGDTGDFIDVKGEPSTTTCDNLSYDYAAKTGQAKGNVVVKQKSRTLWADEATYDQNVELVTLRGNVRMKNTGEEELREMKDADTVTVSLENDWIDIVAKPGGVVTMDFEVPEDE